MEEEIWKDIPGYEGKYQVSNLGRVKRLFKEHERLLKPMNNIGYLYVSLCTKCKKKERFVHSLVMEAFVGPKPEGMDVCHNDGNGQNNHLDNLRYDTRRNNLIDMVKQKRQHFQKLSVDDIKEIKELLDKKELTQKQIATMYNIKQATVSTIKTNKRWAWLTEE